MFILLLYSYDDRVFYANASCVRHGIPRLGRGTSTSDQQPRNEAAYSRVLLCVCLYLPNAEIYLFCSETSFLLQLYYCSVSSLCKSSSSSPSAYHRSGDALFAARRCPSLGQEDALLFTTRCI